MFKKIGDFFREVRVEATKVSWPGREEIIGSTVVVISVVIILSVFTGVTDLFISQLLEFLLIRK